MVLLLLGSPLLAAGRLNPFTLKAVTNFPILPSSYFSISSLPTPSKKNTQNTLNLVRGIMEEANNEGEWVGAGNKKEGGMSSDPQKILSNRTGTLKR